MELRDEDEQIAAIKQWWDENGKFVLAAVGLAVAGTFGWEFYQDQQVEAGAQRSGAYQNVLNAANGGTPAELLDAAGLVQQNYADTEYARLATLFAAKALVETDDLDGAAVQLKGLTERVAVTDPVGAEARLRLATVQLSQGDHAAALATLDDSFSGAYQGRALELRGDALLASGDRAAAKQAYAEAQALTQAGELPLLQLKLDDLADV